MLVVIHSICHKYDDTKQGTMALIETDMVLYTMWKKAYESPAEFIQLFKEQGKKLIHMGERLGITPRYTSTT